MIISGRSVSPSSPLRGASSRPVCEDDGRHLPFEGGSFDVVWSSNVIEHVGEIDAFEAEIRRVLTPEGLAVHALPTASWRLWTSLALYPKLPVLLAELWRTKRARTALVLRRVLSYALGSACTLYGLRLR